MAVLRVRNLGSADRRPAAPPPHHPNEVTSAPGAARVPAPRKTSVRTIAGPLPAARTSGGMYRKLVVGYATDRRGADAIALTRLLASARSVEDVVIVEASHGHRFSGSHGEAGTPSAERDIGSLGEGWPPDVLVSPRLVSGASPAAALASAADEVEADLLVLGSSHRGFAGRVLAGTTAGGI